MAQIEERSSGRNANYELNLIPFIDLMSVLITFLLITAVWTQVSMIQLGSSIYGKKTDDQEVTPPPPMADIPLRLDVKDFGYRLIVGSDRFEMRKAVDGTYDTEALLERLAQVKENYPEKNDAVITVDDEMEYETLIVGMDMLNRGGFPSISVSTVGAE